ncbi:MAG: class I SAM-dependent methyltransferase [Flavobacteriales bacterium]|nr:class I SAM-dependent methyltransferase [Flavobacteriales bacterium]
MADRLRPYPSAYDQEFTFSHVGVAQRRMVWDHLDHMLRMPGMDVLELNCGTGTDAVHLARNGHRVFATDISAEMLKVARERARQMGVEDMITHERMGFDELADHSWQEPFDLVLSDFGGLNCIDPDHLRYLVDPIADSLKPGGRFIAVVMPDRCITETVHHFMRGRLRTAFRRGRIEPIWAGLSGTGVATWYHAPDVLRSAFAHRFKVVDLRPIGLFVPPVALERHLSNKPGTLERLSAWDARTARWRWAARYADHYLIDLERLS